MDKIIIDEAEQPVAIQIFGNDPEQLAAGAVVCQKEGAATVDLNFGCPVKIVCRKGSGAGMMRTPELMAEIVAEIKSAVDIPLTVKTRLGWDSESINIVEIAKLIEEAGADMLTVHCRTREQAFSGNADWSWIPKIKENSKIPLILNGDIKSPLDAQNAFENYCADGIMIGRAMIGDPLLAYRTKKYLNSGELIPETPPTDKLKMCKIHYLLNLAFYGWPRGMFEFRKYYSWYFGKIEGADEVRYKLVRCEDPDEILQIQEDFLIDINRKFSVDSIISEELEKELMALEPILKKAALKSFRSKNKRKREV